MCFTRLLFQLAVRVYWRCAGQCSLAKSTMIETIIELCHTSSVIDENDTITGYMLLSTQAL